MTLQEALEYGKDYLQSRKIVDGQLDAWYLLEYVMQKDRTYYYLHQNDELEKQKEFDYKEVLRLRGEHTPLQHITQEQEFMGFSFYVNEHVLIPRQDTEILVEEVLKRVKKNMIILDMCTGSGCIIVSIKGKSADVTAYASDISKEALTVAKENAKKNKTEISFIQSNLFDTIQGKYDIIVSNPPYIPTKVVQELMEEVKEHEPVIALDGKEDGLYFYREIIRSAGEYLNPKGFLCFEIGYDQGEAVSLLMKEAGFCQVVVIKDLAGLDRVVIGNT